MDVQRLLRGQVRSSQVRAKGHRVTALLPPSTPVSVLPPTEVPTPPPVHMGLPLSYHHPLTAPPPLGDGQAASSLPEAPFSFPSLPSAATTRVPSPHRVQWKYSSSPREEESRRMTVL